MRYFITLFVTHESEVEMEGGIQGAETGTVVLPTEPAAVPGCRLVDGDGVSARFRKQVQFSESVVACDAMDLDQVMRTMGVLAASSVGGIAAIEENGGGGER